MDPIESEARAYVEAYRCRGNEHLLDLEFQYLIAAVDALDARDAEIARLEEVAGDAYEKHYQEVSRLRAQIEQLHAAGYRQAETIARLGVLPGADVLALASEAVDSWVSGDGFTMAEHVARALQQYGDERAAGERQQRFRPISAAEVERARAAAIEEAIVVVNDEGWIGDDSRPLLTSLRALVTKPGSDT